MGYWKNYSYEIYGKKEGITENNLLTVELMRSIWPDAFKEFCIHQSFRDIVKENIDESKQLETISKIRQKSRDETEILDINEKGLSEIKNECWEFINKTKESLFEIKDWKLYRNVSALSKDSTDSFVKSNFGSSSLHKLEGHTDIISSIAVLPDGKIVSGSSNSTIRVW